MLCVCFQGEEGCGKTQAFFVGSFSMFVFALSLLVEFAFHDRKVFPNFHLLNGVWTLKNIPLAHIPWRTSGGMEFTIHCLTDLERVNGWPRYPPAPHLTLMRTFGNSNGR
jgi:hypothetical protein